MKKRLVKIFLIIVLVFVISISIWINITYEPDATAMKYMSSTETVSVLEKDFGLSFTPQGIMRDAGIIFYPGAKVEPEAYSPIAFKLAEKGYQTIIVKMPFNLAVLDSDRGKKVMDHYKEIEYWYIGGHSLGGAMAGNFAHENKELIEGVFFLGAYPVKDFSKTSIDILIVNGSVDGILNEKRLDAAEAFIPNNSQNITIEGGNHSQFGSYGLQKNDQVAEITFEEQLNITIEEIIDLVENKY